MSLQYNILWVDDKKDDYQTLEIDKDLESYLKDRFFEPHIYMYETVEEAEANIGNIRYDIIFSDFNISENKNGKDFITDIRKQNINSEILFYTAQKNSLETGFDRISFLHLKSDTAYDDLKTKMKFVIDLTVEKLNVLTNLRGLVMSEVSELDVMMKNLVADYCKNNEENEKELRQYIIGNIEERIKKSLKISNCEGTCYHKWKDEEISSIVFEQNFDSYTTARALNHILKKKSDLKIKNFFKEYNDEIISNRNCLAHCQTKLNENGIEILVTNKGEKEFTSDDVSNIRKNIMKFHTLFVSLKENI